MTQKGNVNMQHVVMGRAGAYRLRQNLVLRDAFIFSQNPIFTKSTAVPLPFIIFDFSYSVCRPHYRCRNSLPHRRLDTGAPILSIREQAVG